MFSAEQLLEKINRRLAELTYPTQPQGLYEPIRYVLSMGGKRIRPVLLLMAYNLYRDDVDAALPAAIGLETYHNYTLLHDDLMDRADIRRGKPTVHKAWDENTAILSGDTMLVLAYRQLLSCHNEDVLRLFTDTAVEIGEGQQYDMNFERRMDVTESEYLKMIRLKTSVLLAAAARIGAMLAGAPAADADLLYRFAEQVGLAFQLQDDYLDVYGDPAVFGKKIGGDILCDKKTYLLINAWNRADADTRAELTHWIEVGSLDAAEKIRAVTDIYNRLGIPQLCQSTIGAYMAQAQATLSRLTGCSAERRAVIQQYAHALIGRQQ